MKVFNIIKKIFPLIYLILIIIFFFIFDNNKGTIIISTIAVTSIILIIVLEVIIDKKHLELINNYIKDNKIDNVGKYNFWNRKNLLLTDNYIFIVDKKVIMYKYDDINKIESDFSIFRRRRGSFYYRKIIFKDGYEISFQENDYFLNSDELDFLEYMKKRNNKIIMSEINLKLK